MNISIKPGQVCYDTEGKRIQAHGGAVYYENDTFYWYGENKETTDGVSKIWTSGIRFYSSKDLYNWKDEGLIIPPVEEDEDSPMHPHQRVDRPHIIFNDTTGKYVMWFKTSGDRACFTILTADSLLGSYELIKTDFRPMGKKVGDFDLVKDEKTGKAYLYFDGDHAGMTTVELQEDYLDVKGDVTTVDFGDLNPPFCREAMSHIYKDGKHYMVTSGMTGYIPNPSEVAVSKEWFGPFMVLGDPHTNDESSASFNSQISYIFKHPKKKDLYIAMADRWVPEYHVTKEVYGAMVRAIGARYNPSIEKPSEEDIKSLKESPLLASANTSIADYVWLPLRFDGEMIYIDWKEEWRVEDYEDADC